MNKKIEQCDFYLFYCFDLETEVGWEVIEDFAKDKNTVFASGWLVGETKQNYLICADIDPHNHHSNRRMQIPKSIVIDKKKIPEVKRYVSTKFKR